MKGMKNMTMTATRALLSWLSPLGLTIAAMISPPATSAAEILVGAGDIAGCSSPFDEATATLIDAIPGTVFTTGDNAYQNATAAEFTNCYGPSWGRHKARTRPTPGNHDYQSTGAAPYYSYFGANAGPAGRGYYSYTLGAWHVLALNSSVPASAGSAQEQWVRTELAANPAACTIAYWHHPVFSSGRHGNNPHMANILKVLYAQGVDIVLNGHDHTYERFAPMDPDGQLDMANGFRQFIIGTGGISLYEFNSVQPNSEVRNNTSYGVLKLTLNASSYDWEFVPIAGQTFRDRGSAACVAPSTTPSVTLPATDGWNVKDQKSLASNGTLPMVTTSDNNRIEVEAGTFVSLMFESGVPLNKNVHSAKVFIEHHEEVGFAPGAIAWQVGGGPLAGPTAYQSTNAAVLLGEAGEKTVEWDMTASVNTAAKANDVKLVFLNNDYNGKKIKIDRAYVKVTYGDGAPPPPTATDRRTAVLPVDGWDSKNQKTLVQDGKLSMLHGSDNKWMEIEGNQFLTVEFEPSLPADAVIQSAVLRIEHHEEAGFSTGALVWQVGGGTLANPTPWLSVNPSTLGSEAVETWDVTSVVTTAQHANQLKFAVLNRDPSGKKVKIDQVSHVINYRGKW